jgi:D-alanyl-D-alanine-carboxypeptidase/D-alanyl-D-alanine-endopeptidase
MKYVVALLGLLAVGDCMAAQTSLLPDRVEKAIQERIADGQYPALVIAVVDGDRGGVYSYGKLDQGNAPDADTVFEIGSITKTFTATLLAKAVLDGKLKLDMPVASLLPGFSIPSRNGKAITLENLAMQHSGLPRMPTNIAPANENDPFADYDGAKLKAFLAGYKLPRDPGSDYEYSNVGVGLLGYAMAQYAHVTYDGLLHAQIVDPLGMHASDTALSDRMRAHLASGHDESGKPAANWNFDALVGAGAIKSSGADMLLFLKANMGLLRTPLYPAMQLAQQPRASAPAIRPDDRIGLVWMTQHGDDGDVIWHNGGTGGYRSFIGFTGDRRHGVVVLTNIDAPVDDIGFATLQPDAKLAATHKRIPISAAAAEEYVGSYQRTMRNRLKILRTGDQLYGQYRGDDPFQIYAYATDEFFQRGDLTTYSFRRDASHKVNAVVTHDDGDTVIPRLSQTEAAGADAVELHDAKGPESGREAVALDVSTLAGYVGHYQLAPGVLCAITLTDGQMTAQLTDQDPLPIYASAKDRFFLKVVDAQIDFERDAKGKVIALILHQNGSNQRAQRTGD